MSGIGRRGGIGGILAVAFTLMLLRVAVVLIAFAVPLLLYGEWHARRPVIWIAKPLASLGFVLAAVANEAFATRYGVLVFVALVLSFAGDVLLIPKRTFLAGLGAFLLAHVAFAAAFVERGFDRRASGAAFIALVVVAAIVHRWLSPHLPSKFRLPVLAYIAAIVVMASLALGVRDSWFVRAGAVAFFLSDLSVARDQFVSKSFTNKAWGLPLYYAAQLLLACSVVSPV